MQVHWHIYTLKPHTHTHIGSPLSVTLISFRLEDTEVFDIEHNRGRQFISFNKVR